VIVVIAQQVLEGAQQHGVRVPDLVGGLCRSDRSAHVHQPEFVLVVEA
jgi:hypothetical protein